MLQVLKRATKQAYYSWRVEPVVKHVWNSRLTYLPHPALQDLHEQCLRMEREGIAGSFIEAGCARGGSAIVMTAAKAKPRPMYLYDVFGLIPAPSDNDDEDCHDRYQLISSGDAIGPHGTLYYGYEENLQQVVEDNFAKCGYPVAENSVHLVKGLFEETLNPQEPVAIAHVDGDWFNSVWVCLERIVPKLSVGGVLVIDDYDAWSGCRKAVDQFFQQQLDGEFVFVHRSRLHIERVR